MKIDDSLSSESGGNIFVVNSKLGGAIEQDTSVSVSWMNDSVILINFDHDLQIYHHNTAVGGSVYFTAVNKSATAKRGYE